MLTRMRRKGNLCALFVGMKIGTALWKTICFLKKKIKIELPYYLAVPFLGFYLKKTKILL